MIDFGSVSDAMVRKAVTDPAESEMTLTRVRACVIHTIVETAASVARNIAKDRLKMYASIVFIPDWTGSRPRAATV